MKSNSKIKYWIIALSILFLVFITVLSIPIFHVFSYFKYEKDLKSQIPYCSNQKQGYKEGSDINSCYSKLYQLLLSHLILYTAYANKKPLKFVYFASGYMPSEYGIDSTDVLLGYGIGDSIYFENTYFKLFNKPVWGFDCGVHSIPFLKKGVIFESECIGTDKYLIYSKDGYKQISSGRIHSFGEKLKQLNLLDKKVYLKLDIAGAEYEVMPDILKYSDNIVEMALTIHLDCSEDILKTIKMLTLIEKDFVLVNKVNKFPNNVYLKYSEGLNPSAMTLTYMNKKYIDSYRIKYPQNNPEYEIIYNETTPDEYLKDCSKELSEEDKIKYYYRYASGISPDYIDEVGIPAEIIALDVFRKIIRRLPF